MENHEKVELIGTRRHQSRGMYELLQEYARAGIAICLEGKEARPDQVATTCLREGVNYMMDFVPSDSEPQKIMRIDFTRINDLDIPSALPADNRFHHSNVTAYEGWCS